MVPPLAHQRLAEALEQQALDKTDTYVIADVQVYASAEGSALNGSTLPIGARVDNVVACVRARRDPLTRWTGTGEPDPSWTSTGPQPDLSRTSVRVYLTWPFPVY